MSRDPRSVGPVPFWERVCHERGSIGWVEFIDGSVLGGLLVIGFVTSDVKLGGPVLR